MGDTDRGFPAHIGTYRPVCQPFGLAVSYGSLGTFMSPIGEGSVVYQGESLTVFRRMS